MKVEAHISDDLKSNFRSWEYDCDNEADTSKLINNLHERHPDIPIDIITELAGDWTGYSGENNNK